MFNNDPKKNSNKPPLIYLRDTEPEFRAWVSTFFGDTIISVLQFGMTVGLELVRHLAIVNGAGLAGVTALYSAADLPKKAAVLSSSGWFLGGLTLAMFTMLVLYAAGSFIAARFTGVVSEWVGNIEPFDPARLRAMRLLAIPTWTVGLASFACFIVGAAKLIFALKIQL